MTDKNKHLWEALLWFGATLTLLLNQLFSINIKQALGSKCSPKYIPNVLADLADAAIFKVCDILGCTFLIPQKRVP